MDERLNQAAMEGNIDALYFLVRESSLVLDRIDELPFVDTPLHVAAASGQTQFAAEILILKPSFARKRNQDGFSPLQLALQNGHTRLVRWLISCDPELLCVQSREGMTPLHYVTQTENLDLIAEFLRLCPKSMEVETIRGETALHIALRYQKYEAFKFQLSWLQYACNDYLSEENSIRILNRVDQDGNTVLHIAASINQAQTVQLLIKSEINLNAINVEGLTAMDILQSQPDNARICKALWRAGALPASMVLEFTEPSVHLRSEKLYIHYVHTWLYRAVSHLSDGTRDMLFGLAAVIVGATYPVATSNSPSPSGACQATQNLTSTIPQNSSMTYNTENSSPGDTQRGYVEDNPSKPFSNAAFAVSIFVIYVLFIVNRKKEMTNPIFCLLLFSLLCFMGSFSVTSHVHTAPSEMESLVSSFCGAILILFFMYCSRVLWNRRKELARALKRRVLRYRRLPATSTELYPSKKL